MDKHLFYKTVPNPSTFDLLHDLGGRLWIWCVDIIIHSWIGRRTIGAWGLLILDVTLSMSRLKLGTTCTLPASSGLAIPAITIRSVKYVYPVMSSNFENRFLWY